MKLQASLTGPVALAALGAAVVGAGVAFALLWHPLGFALAVAGLPPLLLGTRRAARVSKDVAQELHRLQAATSELAQGVYIRRPADSRFSELHTLGESINSLAGRLEVQMAELAAQAFYDPLTKLPNRTLFIDRLERMLARMKRRRGSVAVLFLDLDNFKVINDSLGHDVGDHLLVAVARRLQGGVRQEDTVARFGGDEFAVATAEITQPADAVNIAQRIAQALAAPFTLEGQELFVTASIGIALNSSDTYRPETLLRDADLAMYKAKLNGKARFEIYSQDMQVQTMERLRLETDLRRAIERGELRVYYQPVVDLRTRQITEIEALVRWEHPQRGLISPADFIPVAEETGLIAQLGHRVLLDACQQATAWREHQPGSPYPKVSVNLSARQFTQPGLVKEIQGMLHQTGLPAEALRLEITEGILMKSEASTFAVLFELKDLGVDLALDDFGMGYSSLAYLKRFPFSALKIDRSFVHRAGRDPEDTAIIRAIITIAKALHMEVVGEGVETADQYEQLLALGCDRGQGFFFARPMPGEAVAELLRTGARGR